MDICRQATFRVPDFAKSAVGRIEGIAKTYAKFNGGVKLDIHMSPAGGGWSHLYGIGCGREQADVTRALDEFVRLVHGSIGDAKRT